jgi:hypothetical protein
MVANQKNTPVSTIYLSSSFLSVELIFSQRNINQTKSAKRLKNITHKSDLLSTITKKAPIPLVNRISKVDHHTIIQI